MADDRSNRAETLSSGDLQRFTSALGDLKRAGCMVLVTGTVDESVRAAVSRRLFGTPTLPRKRVLVDTDDTALQRSAYLPNEVTPDSASVHCCAWGPWEPPLRDATIESQGNRLSSDGGPPDLAACSERLTRVLATVEPTSDELVPSELRVGILTLTHVLDQYGSTATATFLTRLSQRLKSRRGMGHCHLSVPSDSALVRSLADTVDIHIRLRDRTGHPPEQCWYLRETEHTPMWIPLDVE